MKIYLGPKISSYNQNLVVHGGEDKVTTIDNVQRIVKGFGKSKTYYALIGEELSPLTLGVPLSKSQNSVYSFPFDGHLCFKSKYAFRNFYKKHAREKINSLIRLYKRYSTFPNIDIEELASIKRIIDQYITHFNTSHMGLPIVITSFPLNSILSIEAVNGYIVIKSSNRNGVMHITQNKRHAQAYLARNYKWKYYNSLYQKQHKHVLQLEYLRLGLMASLDNFKNE